MMIIFEIHDVDIYECHLPSVEIQFYATHAYTCRMFNFQVNLIWW